MIDSPLISVQLPVHNAERYVAEAIESILAQTVTDFEFIIIDDGSTDNTLQVLQSYQAKDARIRLIAQQHKGIVGTINNAIDLARGKWSARMDADDIALPQRFERQLQWLAETGADVCGGWAQFFGMSNARVLKHPQSDAAIKTELLFMSPFANPTVMMKTNLVQQLRYLPAFEYAEDYDLWQRAARAGWKMTNIPEVLLHYRRHTAQISTRSTQEQQAVSLTIRRQAWQQLGTQTELKPAWIEAVLALRESMLVTPNMDDADSAFCALLQSTEGEAREVALDYLTGSYLRAAGSDASVITRWSLLHERFGKRLALKTRLKFYLFTLLRLKPNSFWQTYLQKIQWLKQKLFSS
jgi:glycosyltransferase involved in cell wall biosynthesis